MAARVFPLSKRLRKKRKNEAGIMNESRTAFAGWRIRPAAGSRKLAQMNSPGPSRRP